MVFLGEQGIAAAGGELGERECVSASICIVCGDRRFDRIYADRMPWLSRCRACGIAFVDPQPAECELTGIYDQCYYEHFGYVAAQADGAYRNMKRAACERLMELAETVVRLGQLLDVGSALGDLLVIAKYRGWDVRGIDLNRFAVNEADRQLPGATCVGALENFVAANESFDLITCTDVLEHVRRPDQSLRRMYELLRAGGGLLITTIDAGGWPARLCGSHWVHFHRDHLWYFNRETLTCLVNGAGFELLKWQVPRKVFNLRYLLGILAHEAKVRVWKRSLEAGLRRLPDSVLSRLLPPLPEGQLLLARKPERSTSGT